MSLDDEAVRRLRASAHPVRLRIMSLLTGAEQSAAEVARELGITQANASYHLRQLADVGLIEVTSTEKVRGGIAKRYRYVVEREERIRRESTGGATEGVVEAFPMIAAALASELERRSRLYAPNASDQPDNVYADLETWVDPEVWREVTELVLRASGLAHKHARPPRTDGTIPVSFVASLFRMRTPEIDS
jgi:DNA-binding transcriptional ArsR family regulator